MKTLLEKSEKLLFMSLTKRETRGSATVLSHLFCSVAKSEHMHSGTGVCQCPLALQEPDVLLCGACADLQSTPALCRSTSMQHKNCSSDQNFLYLSGKMQRMKHLCHFYSLENKVL